MIVYDPKAQGLRVKLARIKAELSQEQLAERAGFSVQHISNIESGRGNSSTSAMVSIVNALGITMDNIFCDSVAAVSLPYLQEINDLLEGCDPYEIRALRKVIELTLELLRQSREEPK